MFKIFIFTLLSLSTLYCLPYSPDSKVNCLNSGVGYSDGNGNFFCKCAPYTSGKQCQIIITPAPVVNSNCYPCQVNNKCKNSAKCVNVYDVTDTSCELVCDCPTGYYGTYCQFQRSNLPL